jgi:hypothetical protein
MLKEYGLAFAVHQLCKCTFLVLHTWNLTAETQKFLDAIFFRFLSRSPIHVVWVNIWCIRKSSRGISRAANRRKMMQGLYNSISKITQFRMYNERLYIQMCLVHVIVHDAWRGRKTWKFTLAHIESFSKLYIRLTSYCCCHKQQNASSMDGELLSKLMSTLIFFTLLAIKLFYSLNVVELKLILKILFEKYWKKTLKKFEGIFGLKCFYFSWKLYNKFSCRIFAV